LCRYATNQMRKGAPPSWPSNSAWPVLNIDSLAKGAVQCMALELMSAVRLHNC
jgi:hypothetical protein